jgi:WD40 repeat protein
MLIATALSDGTIRVVDLRCQDAVTCYADLSSDGPSSVHATSVCWSPDNSFLVGSLGNGDVALLDLRTGAKQACIKKAHMRSCFGAVFQKSPDHPTGSSHFATWSSDGSVR